MKLSQKGTWKRENIDWMEIAFGIVQKSFEQCELRTSLKIYCRHIHLRLKQSGLNSAQRQMLLQKIKIVFNCSV